MKLLSQWTTFSSAPHRMFFFGGIAQSLLTIIWWLIDLGGRFSGLYLPISWSISSTDAHAFMMIYGFFPFFIFGFLMTTYPRWMNGEEVERRLYVPAFIILFSGALLFYVGLIASLSLLKVALCLFLIGWAIGLHGLLRVYLRAKHPDKRHAAITSIVLLLGWILLAGFTAGDPHAIAFAKTSGIWVFLLPVFFAISHRMIPFFSGNIIPHYKIVRPNWALTFIPLGALLHVLFEISGHQALTWVIDLPMAVCAIYLSIAWRLRASLAVPILGMLHIGFVWLSLALLLYSIQSVALLLTGELILAKAPLHAMTIGFFSSMLLAMVTRVTLGHSGKTMQADKQTWCIFLLFQLAAILRISSEIPGVGILLRNELHVCAAIIWLIVFSFWSCKYALIYLRPRLDGISG